MKKILLLLLLMPVSIYADTTAVVGPQWKQIDSTVYPADDVTGINISGLSNYTGFPASTLQDAYDGGDTITTDTNAVTIKDGGSGVIQEWQKSDGTPVMSVYSSGVVYEANLAILEDVKSSGTSGGTCTASSYIKRDLNTEKIANTFVNLSTNNEFIVQPGTYYIWASAPAHLVAYHRSNIYNVTDATYLTNTDKVTNPLMFAGLGTNIPSSVAEVYGRFTITSEKVFSLMHRCSSTKATTGFGLPYAAFSENEIYGRVFIRREN
jgi:hypothetical protein